MGVVGTSPGAGVTGLGMPNAFVCAGEPEGKSTLNALVGGRLVNGGTKSWPTVFPMKGGAPFGKVEASGTRGEASTNPPIPVLITTGATGAGGGNPRPELTVEDGDGSALMAGGDTVAVWEQKRSGGGIHRSNTHSHIDGARTERSSHGRCASGGIRWRNGPRGRGCSSYRCDWSCPGYRCSACSRKRSTGGNGFGGRSSSRGHQNLRSDRKRECGKYK
jgi:hypothetical protein